MADSVVAFLLEHLSQLLEREAKLLYGVEDIVRSLHNELELINVYLKTSSEGKKRNKKEIKKKVVNQIKDVAHLASRQGCHRHIRRQRRHAQEEKRAGKNAPWHWPHKVAPLCSREIDKIKTTINEIHENKIKYDSYQESSDREEEERAQSLHRIRRNVEDDDVMGFFHKSKGVINRPIDGGSQRKVISIIGMGGLGKTTLARKVYNSDEVKKHFNCRTWVYVSNECRPMKILLGLVKHLMPNPEYGCRSSSNKKGKKHKEVVDRFRDLSSLNEDELKKAVWEYLKWKRYLLVLDDLWKRQDWDEVKAAFPDGNRGSRILITSRLKEVASHTSSGPPYYLQFLTEEQSWELFSRKVFRGEEYACDLTPLGEQMVKSCGGLPLSIIVLAGLLANKEKSHREWYKVVGHVNWYLTRDETQVKDIVLKLNYDNLPTRFKPCFLYLGIFPEDSEIRVRQPMGF